MAFNLSVDGLLKLSSSKKVLILLGVNVVIVALIYSSLTVPQFNEVRRLNSQYSQLVGQLEENRMIASDIPKYKAEKLELESKLESAVAQLPNKKELPNLIDSISNVGEKSGLTLLLFKPEAELNKGFYAEIPIKMAVEGMYESLYDFSAKVGSLSRIVNLSGMKVASTGHKQRVPVLKASFTATTFRFVNTLPGEEPVKKK